MWVVICFENGEYYDVVGPFASEQVASEWVDRMIDQQPPKAPPHRYHVTELNDPANMQHRPRIQ